MFTLRAAAAMLLSILAVAGCDGGGFEGTASATGTGGRGESSTASAGGAGGAGSGGESGGGAGGGSTSGTGGGGTFTLASFKLKDGDVFEDTFTCAGEDMSLPLDWQWPPAATQSFAVVFFDESHADQLHWVIWDIPVSVPSLAGNIPKIPEPPMPAGSKQAKSLDGMTYGYLGPCPGGTEHVYRFVLHALDVETLPGVTTDSSMMEVATVIQAHSLETASLSGKSSATPK